MSSSLLVQALQGQPLIRPPVWLMRQAGRYLPEYRAIRANFPNFLEFCFNSEAATEVTLQPVTRFNMDAAIIFADILTIPHVLGHPVSFTEGEGPRVTPLTTPAQVAALSNHMPALTHNLAPVSRTIALTRAALPPHQAVIGFSGGPFTLACYMLDAKPSQGIPNTLAFAREHPESFQLLITTLTTAIVSYLSQQITAGASAVQVFESWALLCPSNLWPTAMANPLRSITTQLKELHPTTPIILFPRGASQQQLQALASSAPALSLGTDTDLTWAIATIPTKTALQGNLDPLLLNGDAQTLRKAVTAMLAVATPRPGYVFNLGHGLTPQALPDNVKLLVDTVHAYKNPSL